MNSTGLTEFETQLKTVVTAKRLSGSKMAALTELAVENMHLDTQMISLMYRTHKGLPARNKISSLYVFDSVARAAHRTKSKRGLVADLNTAGNAASFLVRLEGMLDGIVEDMLANGPPEAKEKSRKVLDIWTREGTFPASALKRLSEKVSGGSSAAPVVTQGAYNVHYMLLSLAIHLVVPTGCQAQSHTPPTPATPSSAIASLPPAILALLGTAPTQPPPPQQFTLDPTQLALISQLTAASSQSATPPFSPARNGTTVLPAAISTPDATPNGSFSPTAPPYSPVRKDIAPPGGAPSFERSRSGSPTRREEDRRERGYDQRSPKARFGGADERGSRFNDGDSRYNGDGGSRYNDGRRGDRSSRRYDDRSPRTTDPRTRDPRRRSRSPRRGPSPPPRNRRPPSPSPRRAPSPSRASGRAPLPGAGEAGKDEFGRVLRGGSPARSPAQAQPQSYQTGQPQSYQPPPAQQNQAPAAQGGLEAFDMSMFNPADATSWTNLAAAWQVTNGRGPTQEEMMMFVMGGSMGGNAASRSGGDGGSGYGQGRGRGRGRGGFRGRGRGRGRGGFGGGHGEAYGGYGGDAYGGGFGGGSDAVVLGGGEDTGEQGYGNQEYGNAQGYGNEQGYGEQDFGGYDTNPSPATSGGGMKKIDGKWEEQARPRRTLYRRHVGSCQFLGA
ncbi:hypothetical protein FRC11_012409 [Ceratobasidium sp. 423]|nr:hypothetical protein FRC11_012409 [Ceratobasidium sp. 423]